MKQSCKERRFGWGEPCPPTVGSNGVIRRRRESTQRGVGLSAKMERTGWQTCSGRAVEFAWVCRAEIAVFLTVSLVRLSLLRC